MSATTPATRPDFLATIRAQAGGVQDSEYGGVVADLLAKIDRPEVRRIMLSGGLTDQAEPVLVDDVPAETLFIVWAGLGRILLARDGTPCAAYVAPVTDGYFAGAVTVEFLAAPGGKILPFPGRVIVDRRQVYAHISRADRLRVRAGRPTACGCDAKRLEQMDRGVIQIDDFFVRTAEGIGTKPAYLNDELADSCRTWTGRGSEAALASTCVEIDTARHPLFSPDRRDDVVAWAHRLAGFMICVGPRAALEVLGLAERQRRLN